MKNLNEMIAGIKAGYSFFYVEGQEVNKTVKQINEDCFGEGSTCDGVTIYNDDGEIVEMYDEDGDLMD